MEEYLQVIPLELDIIKQEYKGKNLELKKKIEKLQEEKMHLSLDVDLQKKEVEKVRKEKKEEKENKGLKTKVTELVRSLRWHRNHDPTVELKELRSKVEDLEVALHDGELQIEQLEVQENCIKGELHQVKGQVRDRDYIIGEAIAQIREIAEYVRDLALLRATDKGKAPVAITGEEGEDHPLGFTLPYVPLQTEAHPRRPSVTVRPQHGSVDAGILVNFPSGSGNNWAIA
ncbi:uncharacterized protein [Gossypium hirsutum]|uniref:Uncharacterized protein n=1 Tax=Gossypium hirsutum TaxID=3635 RepID=A0ABM3A6H3_GOSHI|nr:uncharacterized protein LOC121217914 [Gossypium hirsutum]